MLIFALHLLPVARERRASRSSDSVYRYEIYGRLPAADIVSPRLRV